MLRHWIAAAGAVALAGTAAPAMADDSFFGRTNCADSSQPGCEVVVESQETTPGSPGIGGDSGNRGTGSAAAEPDCETDRVSARCTVTVSTGGSGGEEGVDFAAFAYAARAAFQLPAPGIAMSPSADTPILVQVPVWLWIAPPRVGAPRGDRDRPGRVGDRHRHSGRGGVVDGRRNHPHLRGSRDRLRPRLARCGRCLP